MKISVNTNEVANNETSALKGFANVTFEDKFVVKNISIISGKNGLFVSMPNYRTNKVNEKGEYEYKDVFHPITKEFRDELNKAVMESFTKKEDINITLDDKFSIQAKSTAYEKDKLLGFASLVISDMFVVNDIRILQGKNGSFVAMPSQKTGKQTAEGKDIYRDVCFPITKDFRTELLKEIMGAYQVSKDHVDKELSEDFEKVAEGENVPTR